MYNYKVKGGQTTQEITPILRAYARLMGATGWGTSEEELHSVDERVAAALAAFEAREWGGEDRPVWAARRAFLHVAGIAASNMKNVVVVSSRHYTDGSSAVDVTWKQFWGKRELGLIFQNQYFWLTLVWDKPLQESKFARWCGWDKVLSLTEVKDAATEATSA